jgi:hypothetical protein
MQTKFFTEPAILVSSEIGALGLFVTGLLFYATNPEIGQGWPDRLTHGYGHRIWNFESHENWFPRAADPGKDDFYDRWMTIHRAITEATGPNDIVDPPIPATVTQRNAADLAAWEWEPTPGVVRVLHGHAYTTLSSLFEGEQFLLISYKLQDTPQLAYNFVMLDCLRQGWISDLQPHLDRMNSTRDTPISLEDMIAMLQREDHLELQEVHDLVATVKDALHPFPYMEAAHESGISASLDPDYRTVVTVDFGSLSDISKAHTTAEKLVHFLGDKCKIDTAAVEDCIVRFLGSIKQYPS